MDQAFLDEALENAEAFSAGMVDLERVPEGDEVALLNDLFRRAHNLKGMAAMEDVAELAELAHAAEDVLSRYRDAGGRPTASEVDALLEAADGMEAMLTAVAAGQPVARLAALEERLRAFGRADTIETGPAPVARGPLTWPEDVVAGYRVTLQEGTQAPKARARVVVRAASELADAVVVDPPDLEGVSADRLDFVLGVRNETDETVLLDRLRAFAEVESAEPVTIERQPIAPVEAPAEPSATDQHAVAMTVRVDVDRLDELLDLVGELVVASNRLQARVADIDDEPVRLAATGIHGIVADVREVVSRVRMVSLDAPFTRLARVARDVARELGKPIDFTVGGAETELDRSVVDEVLQPLVHLVRNAIDHGVEAPDERRAAGKPETGHVRLEAEQRGAEVVIEVRDDGGGIDTDRLLAKAIERDVVSAAAASELTVQEIYDVMFLPGFTSRDEAGLVSGRGVGLDVVRSSVEALGGSIAVTSSLGTGTTFALHFPLSLVVMDAMLVTIAERTWALPVARCEQVIDRVEGAPEAWPDLPIIDGHHALGRTQRRPDARFGVVVRDGSARYLLTVDHVVGRAEVVVKPAPSHVPGTDHIAGVSVLDEGELALIPDVALVARRARSAGELTRR